MSRGNSSRDQDAVPLLVEETGFGNAATADTTQDIPAQKNNIGKAALTKRCDAVKNLGAWRRRSQKRLDDFDFLFSRLFAGHVSGLVAALTKGDADLLVGDIEGMREHLATTATGSKVMFVDGVAQLQTEIVTSGSAELRQVLIGNVQHLGKDEILSAYRALMYHALRKPVTMKAPVKYNEHFMPNFRAFGVQLGSAHHESVGLESRHTRSVFDLTTVALIGAMPLHLAIDRDAELLRSGSTVEFSRRLLESEADVNSPAHYDTQAPDFKDLNMNRRLQVAVTAIHLAVDRGSVELVALLLQFQASPETRAVFDMRADYTPLHLATANGHEGISRILIEAGANPGETDLSGKTCCQFPEPTLRLPLTRKCSVIAVQEEEGTSVADRALEKTSGTTSESLRPPATHSGNLRRGKTCSTTASTDKQASNDSLSVETRRSINARGKGHVVFKACAEALLELKYPARNSGSTRDPSSDELHRCVFNALDGNDLNDLFAYPLAEGRSYKKTKKLLKGCMLHYAVDLAVQLEQDGVDKPEAVVRLVMRASADVHARAHYKQWGIPHTCTAVHIAAAGGAPAALALLLDAGASVEAMVTNDMKPHYTPLLDAASEGHYETCELLLERRANPNVPNRLGRTCLHNAVLDGNCALACLLAEHGSCVALADSIFQETPLLCTSRAKGGQYPISDMLCLCRAYRNRRYSLLHDLVALATCRDKLSGDLLDYCLNSSGTPAMLLKKEEMLKKMRKVAVEGRPDEHGRTPVDQIATIIESAPRTGVRLLTDVFMATPDVQDATHGTLPVYANLQQDKNSWFPWRRYFGAVDSLTTAYEPDARKRRDDGRPWPCWLFDSTRPDAEPAWHRNFLPKPSDRYVQGNYMVQMKVLLVANVLNANMLFALSRCKDLHIFAEMPVRSLISFAYISLVRDVLIFEKLMEIAVIIGLVVWAQNDGDDAANVRRLSWILCAGICLQDVIVFVWKLRRYLLNGWCLSTFFRCFENFSGPLIHLCHWPLLIFCSDDGHNLDVEHGDELRALLGTAIILRFIRLIMLFRYDENCGTDILAVYRAVGGVFTTFGIMAGFFVAFTTAYFVVRKSPSTGGDLIVNVYRGLMLGDAESLDTIGAMWGGAIGRSLMVMSTAVFTVYLLNIMIAVLTAEYYKADARAPFVLWQERAFKAAQVLLGPVCPWTLDCILSNPVNGAGRPPSPSPVSPGWVARMMQSAQNAELSREEEAELRARKIRCFTDVMLFILCGLAVCSFALPVPAICGSITLGIFFVAFRARLTREHFVGTQRKGTRFYLWVCHRSDYSHQFFVRKEVEQEHIDALAKKVDRMEDVIVDMHKRITALSEHPGLFVSSPTSKKFSPKPLSQ